MQRTLMSVVVLAALLPAARGGDDDPRSDVLVRLESTDEDVLAAAEDEWDALDDVTQLRLARAALADPEAPGAWAAAQAASAWCLDSDELRHAARALLRAPDVGTGACPACLGASDVPAVWGAAGEQIDWFEDLHRVTTGNDVPALLDLAARGDTSAPVRAEIVWTTKVVAWFTDAHRERVAALLAAELETWPDVSVPRPPRDGSGLPAHFETIARCAWGLERDAKRESVIWRVVPWGWLMRWAADVTPTAADLQFLDDVVAGADEDDEARAWALRHRVRLSGDGAALWLASLLEDDDGPDCAAELAAHLALLGKRAPWDALLAHKDAAATTTPLLWRVDRDAALRVAADGAFDLTRLGRERLRAVWGIDVGAADLDAVAGVLAAEPDGAMRLVEFYAHANPQGLRGDAARALADRLVALRDCDDISALDPEVDGLHLVLGLLEVRARGALQDVLRAWLDSDPWLRELAIGALVELGEPVAPDVAWDAWLHRTSDTAWEDTAAIGLHPDPGIAGHLGALARSDDDRASDAVEALARCAGLPRDAAEEAGLVCARDDATRDAFLSDLESGPTGTALLHLFETTQEEGLVAWLAPAALRELRLHRENGLYWHATLGLALSGDAAACDEIADVLRENRTPLFDDVPIEDARFGRRFARLHAERLDHNCCAHFQAVVALRAAFPTIPVSRDWTLATQGRIAREWLDAHEGGLVWSRLADGWLPR